MERAADDMVYEYARAKPHQATLGSLRAMAARKCARASGKARPRGSSTWRARKNPVIAKPSIRSPARLARVLAQKGRQPQQPVVPGLARRPRHRAARFRRHIDEIRGRPRSRRRRRGRAQSRVRRATAARSARPARRGSAIGEAGRASRRAPRARRMRVALRQQPHQRREMGHAVERMRRRQECRRRADQALDGVVAEMLVEPRPPGRAAPSCRAAAPAAAASRPRRAPDRDGGRARASSARGWRSPRRGARRARCLPRSTACGCV